MIPNPVMKTRELMPEVCSAGYIRRWFHTIKYLARIFGVVQFDAVVFIEQHHQFERVDGVEAEAFAKEGRILVEIRGRHSLEVELLDDEGLKFGYQFFGGLHVNVCFN